ncbi:esterase family protein [Antrihabitans cavernicola]|uniref:Esterase family protein n=2 Tax=Antrihabitans cavernicola TaxID=2495913 RepID=A0A5A7S5A6_9NOCA|nr:esterase family protein [Spelaeibacter cavernicola]
MATILLGGQATATADDGIAHIVSRATASTDGSHLDHIERVDDRRIDLYVYSAAMNKVFQQVVLLPKDTSAPRPTLYLLDGGNGGESTVTWRTQTDIVPFFADKNVNVVLPIGGEFSYYTDWQHDDPVLGRNKWKTYLTEELPAIVDSALGTTGKNAIAGLSMSGTSVLALAEAAPNLYQSVGAFSGCADTSSPIGAAYVSTTVIPSGGNPTNMWGPYGSPGWVANDPYVHADKLRGKALFISSGNGLPGPHDTLNDPSVDGQLRQLGVQIGVGGVIEAATNECTHRLAGRLDSLGIPATFSFPPGTHSWGYWQDALHNSWPVLGSAIGS